MFLLQKPDFLVWFFFIIVFIFMNILLNILYILLLYLTGVAIYTIVVKNDSMHKFNPLVKISDIIKEGLRGMGIGFLITGAIIGIIILIIQLL